MSRLLDDAKSRDGHRTQLKEQDMSHDAFLISGLKQAGVTWTIREATVERKGRLGTRTESVILVAMTIPQGELATTFEEPVSIHGDYSLAEMLALVLRKHCKTFPVYRKWLAKNGNSPVELEPGVLECVPEAVHTALRKLADGPTSVLTWNAIYHLHPYDAGQLWATLERVLRDSFARAAEKSVQVQRRKLAIDLSVAVREALREASYTRVHELRSPEGTRWRERTPEQTFALRTFQAGVELTDIEEWMWGWLGYVVKDVPATQAEPEEEQEV